MVLKEINNNVNIFHASCITDEFEKQVENNNNKEGLILKCPLLYCLWWNKTRFKIGKN